MRVLIFSDVHVQEYYTTTVRVKLADFALTAVRQAFDYAKKNKIKTVFFLGDWFHERGKIHTEFLERSISLIEEYSEYFTFYSLSGTHDFDREYNKFSSISSFPDTMSGVKVIEGIKFRFIPANKPVACNPDEVVLLHHDLMDLIYRGIKVNSKLDNTYKSIKNKARGVICGHWHDYNPSNQGVIFPGALMQHNWGDVGKERGFIDVTIPKRGAIKHTFILAKYPEFCRCTRLPKKGDIKGNIFRLDAVSGAKEKDINYLYKKGALYAESLSILSGSSDKREINTPEIVEYPVLWKEYVSSQDLPGAFSRSLLKIGEKFLEEGKKGCD